MLDPPPFLGGGRGNGPTQYSLSFGNAVGENFFNFFSKTVSFFQLAGCEVAIDLLLNQAQLSKLVRVQGFTTSWKSGTLLSRANGALSGRALSYRETIFKNLYLFALIPVVASIPVKKKIYITGHGKTFVKQPKNNFSTSKVRPFVPYLT